ncbi:hypothetical protein ACN94_08215 [Gordonia paraffinivorans]|nr:hypothetical protein [Gordonia paraffinivorans]
MKSRTVPPADGCVSLGAVASEGRHVPVTGESDDLHGRPWGVGHEAEQMPAHLDVGGPAADAGVTE